MVGTTINASTIAMKYSQAGANWASVLLTRLNVSNTIKCNWNDFKRIAIANEISLENSLIYRVILVISECYEWARHEAYL